MQNEDRPVRTVEYSTEAYNSLPDVASASTAYQSCQGDLLAQQLMRGLFRNHGVQATFGLTLLHRHHHSGAPPLGAGESMTALSGTKSPAPRQLGAPAVWRVCVPDGHIIPVEFSFEAAPVDWCEDRLQGFIKEFLALLQAHDAQKHFGLCLYPGDGYPGHIEVQDGRDTVGLSPEEAHTLPPGDLVEVAWFYTDDHLKRDCKYYCFNSKEKAHETT